MATKPATYFFLSRRHTFSRDRIVLSAKVSKNLLFSWQKHGTKVRRVEADEGDDVISICECSVFSRRASRRLQIGHLYQKHETKVAK